MAWEVPDRRLKTPRALSLLPASAHGFAALAERGPPGDFRSDRDRWQSHPPPVDVQGVKRTSLLSEEGIASIL